jgi:Tfp pilus assembly protein PilN
MKAVNLIPADARRGGGGATALSAVSGPGYALVGLLSVAVLFVLITVLTGNTIASRKAQLAALRTQVTQETVVAAGLTRYAQFEQMAQQRAETVRTIAASRFDWQGALNDLARVVPGDTTLQTLTGSVVPGAATGGSGGSTGGALRTALTAPAFELTGCTASQDDVARLMSRLRLINDVTTVSLASSQKGGSNGSGGGSCTAANPAFDLVVFFQPVPNAGPSGVASVSVPVASTTATAGAGR